MKDSKNTTTSPFIPKSKSKKCTLSQECTSSCDTEIINDNSHITTEITSPTKQDKVYEHMKKHIFSFLINTISFGKNDLETIQYYSFVKKHKIKFVSKNSFEK